MWFVLISNVSYILTYVVIKCEKRGNIVKNKYNINNIDIIFAFVCLQHHSHDSQREMKIVEMSAKMEST